MDVPAHCYSTDNAGIMWLLKWLEVNMHHCNPPSPCWRSNIKIKVEAPGGGAGGGWWWGLCTNLIFIFDE